MESVAVSKSKLNPYRWTDETTVSSSIKAEHSMSDESHDAAAKQVRKRRAAMALSVTVGAALGAALGSAMDNMGVGVAIGVAVGVAIGVARETRLR